MDDCRNEELRKLDYLRCKRDPVYWCNSWGWTLDPRDISGGRPALIPFDLFPKQQEYFVWLRGRESRQEGGLVEKSREVGMTWLCCAYALHGWLFRDGFQAGFGSHKLEYVDQKGNPKSIFEKVRIMLRELPPWMVPRGFRESEHSLLGRIINPANGSVLTGEGGDNIGRGGRVSLYFVDEAAFLERPDAVDLALSQTTRVRIDVSTPNGPGNPFARKRFGGKVPVFTLHWRDDPRKSQEWYENEVRTKSAVDVAQNLDIDYTASLEGIVIPAAWVRAAVRLKLPPGLPVACGLDVAEFGGDSNVLTVRRGPVVLPPLAWGKCNTTETAWRARDEALRVKAESVAFDCGGVGAGVRGTWLSAGELPFAVRAVNFGESPSSAVWPDGRTAKELFVNLRAEIWWGLRRRFEKAYEFVTLGTPHPPDELISLPDCPQLIAELSAPLAERTETGKIKIESKDRMRSRGVKSPDYADSLALAFLTVSTFGEPLAPVRSVIDDMKAAGLWQKANDEDDDDGSWDDEEEGLRLPDHF